MQRILVTRPEPDNARTAEKLSALGFTPLQLPLTAIKPLAVREWPDPSYIDAIAVTSVNAVRHAPEALLTDIASQPCYAVGERSGEVAGAAGLNVVDAEGKDAEGLVRRITADLAQGRKVLVLCGRVRRPVLQDGLTQAGIETFIVETYDTITFSPSEEEVVAKLEAPVDGVLFYSALAAKAFARISACRLFSQSAYFAISERVGKMLPPAARDRLHIAQEPNEEALLSLLSR